MNYIRQVFSIVIAIIILFVGYMFYKRITSPPSKGTPQLSMINPISVDVYKAVTGVTIPHRLEYPSKTKPYKVIDIIARVSGYIAKINYNDGDFVNKDSVIFEIEDGIYSSRVKQAESGVENQQAILRKAESEFQRIKTLYNEKIASQQDYENALTQYESAKAQLKGLIAQLEIAKMDLGYTKVKSPVSGFLSIRNVEVGSYVQSGTKLVTIQQITPFYAEFSIPDIDNKRYGIVKLAKDGKLKPFLEINNKKFIGHFDFIDSVIDTNTATIKMRAVFSIMSNIIIPGDFVRIKIDGLSLTNGIKIPTKSIIQTPLGPIVYVANNGVVEVRNIIIVAEDNEYSIVSNVLKDNEYVIVNNIMKIKPGAPIKIDRVLNEDSR